MLRQHCSDERRSVATAAPLVSVSSGAAAPLPEALDFSPMPTEPVEKGTSARLFADPPIAGPLPGGAT